MEEVCFLPKEEYRGILGGNFAYEAAFKKFCLPKIALKNFSDAALMKPLLHAE